MDQSVRDDGHSPGVALTEKRDRFVRLIGQGVSNSEACRIVGVNRRTGTRWRFGRSILNTAGKVVHYPAVTMSTTTAERSPRYLSIDERSTIADLHHRGAGVRAIAAELGRAPSTVSRELRANTDELGRYLPFAAQRAADARRPRPRPRRVATDSMLGKTVCDLLGLKWSPEQIAHELRSQFAEPSRRLCPESIYQAIYDPNTVLTRQAKHSLRSHRRRRRRRTYGLQRSGRLTDMTMIAQRPAAVEDRAEAGHWEGDLIMGRGNKSAIGTLVERQARFLMLVHVPGEHTAEAVRDGVTAALGRLPPHLRSTLTWDQGKEMAQHRQIADATGTRVYFCDAHSPWQRGSNENMNGLLRQYFPKGSDLRCHTANDLAAVADEINRRPRKTLNWATPAGLLDQLLSPSSAVACCDDG